MSSYQLKPEKKPPSKWDKTKTVQFRVSEEEYGVLKQKAALYTDGNLSHWIRAALKNYKPRKAELQITD